MPAETARRAAAGPLAYGPIPPMPEPDRLRQLAAGIAHDYNNLLTSVLCGAQLALGSLAPDHPALPPLEIASTAAAKAAALTYQLMAYAGIGPFSPGPVNLSALIRELVLSLQTSIPAPMQLQFDLAADLPPVWADAGQIERLLRALVDNAREAIGDGMPGVIAIRTCAGESGREASGADPGEGAPAGGAHVWLEVTDTGCGMADWLRCRIFEPFFSTKFPGRGLGLAAVAGIVTSNGGTIEVYSAPASGSTFRVSLNRLAEVSGQGVSEPGDQDSDCR